MRGLRQLSTSLSLRRWRYIRGALFAVLLLLLVYGTLSPDSSAHARGHAQTDECVSALGAITESQTNSGEWNGDCLSEKAALEGTGDRYARFYTFTLEERSIITLELTSTGDAYIDETIAVPYLYLMEGHGKSGNVVLEDKDAVPYLTLNSVVAVDLAAGNYTIEATAYGAGNSGSFTLSVEVAEPEGDPVSTAATERESVTGDESRGDDESESDVYTWRDGDRTLRVRLVSNTSTGLQSAQTRGLSSGASSESHSEEDPVFRSEPGGNLMTLPGGVLLVLDSTWEQSDINDFFSENEIDTSLVSELDFLQNAFLIETAPGFASLELANTLAAQEGVEISSPNWRSEIEVSQETVTEDEDDHGDSTDTATELPLNTSVHGVIGADGDEDFFKIVMAESTLVEIRHPPYPVLGNAWNSRRVAILNSDGSDWSWRWGNGSDFIHEVRLAAGTYYLKVFNETHFEDATGYDIYVKTIADHPDTISSATPVVLDSPASTNIHRSSRVIADFHSESDVDVFRLELAEDKEVFVSLATHGLIGVVSSLSPYTVVTLEVLDSDGNPLRRRLLGYNTKVGQYSLKSGTYYLRLSPYPYLGTVKDDENLVPYTFKVLENSGYLEFLGRCTAISSNYDDPLYGCQSHLSDINVAGAWSVTKGEGVNIAIADGAESFDHEDLRDNEDATRNHSYVGSLIDADPREDLARHGLAVAGIISARDNDKGVRGVAPRATIYGYNLVLDSTLSNALDALTRNRDTTGVHNNSWGFRNSAGAYAVSQLWTAALESGVNTGNGGKGVLYVFAAGNRHERGQHVGLHEGKNFYAQTTVCAVDSDGKRVSYSETGYALWVCAPLAKVTTDTWDLYMGGFGGTSSAAPVVSGVAALVRGANADLTWRDVKLILAESASKNDSSNAGWETGASKYASGSSSYHYNSEYGFGVVDAAAAVALSSNWTTLPAMVESTAEVTLDASEFRIPDATANDQAAPLTSTLSISSDIDFTEFVEVNIDLHHQSFRDLEILLQSPSGAVSKLTVPHDEKSRSIAGTYIGNVIRLGTARHLGEDPNGEWTLTVQDHFPEDFGHVWGWGITVYGHSGTGATTSAPSITGATTLTVAEGTTAVAILTATDEDTAVTDLTWSIPSGSAGGTDADSFTITAAGALSFATAKDFETPDDADTDGSYQVSVQVSDGTATDTADLTVTLANVNEAPTADAGADQDNVEQGSTVTISGSGSDPDSGDTLSYSWTQASGNTVSLSVSRSATTTFAAPTGLTADATMVFTLRVTDDGGLYDEDRTSVTVAAPDEVVLSSDATLSSLTLSGIYIGTFSSGTTSYSASVGHSVSSTTVRATPNHDGASVTIADSNSVSYGAVSPISLSTGSNSIRVTVTAEDAVTTKIYTVTVTRAEPAVAATIAPASESVIEGAEISFTVSLSRAAPRALSVAVSVTDAAGVLSGTAPTSVSFAAGDGSKTFTLSTQNDDVIEAASTVTASLAAGSGYTLGTATSASVSVTDNDSATWTVSAQPTRIDEGGSSTITATVVNGKTFAANQTVSLAATGTASVADYTLSATSLTLTAGASSVTATVTAVDDAVVESDETVTVTASRRGQALGSAIVTISDNDVSLSSDATLSSLTLSGVDIGTFSSEATSYSASVENGVSSTTVRATPNDDGASVTISDANGTINGTSYPTSLATGSNSIRVSVAAEDGVTTKVYTVTVTRAEPVVTAPVATIARVSSSVTEGTDVSFTVSLSRAAPSALSVAVSFTDAGGVLSGTSPTSVAFASGDSSMTITLSTQDDDVIEAASSVAASIAAGSGYTLGTTTSASVSVKDDDSATWRISAQPTRTDEGGSSTITVAIANGKTFAADQTVSLAATGDRFFTTVVGGTASHSDYTLLATTLTLTAGASSVTTSVTSTDDTIAENDETVIVTGSHGGRPIGSATVVTITDNDVTLSSDATLSSLTLSGIDIGTFSSETTSYSAGVEYGVSSTTVRAIPTDAAARVTIADYNGITYGTRYPISLSTGSNSVRVNVTAEDGVTTKMYRVSITRAEPVVSPPVATIRAGTTPVTEGKAVVFSVSLNRTAPSALSVAVSVTDAGGVLSGTAPTSVSFAAGDSSKTITLSTQDDDVIEAGSTVTASIAAGSGYTPGTTTTASVSVTDNDSATWTVSAQPAEIDEGVSSTITIAVANSKTFAADQTISLAVTGTASDSDYALSAASLTLTAGAHSVTTSVTSTDDDEDESDETVTVTASHGGQSVGSATVTINDNDVTLSSDATLSSLTLSGIDIGTFSSETTSYSASVEYGVSSTTVRAIPTDDAARVTIADYNGITYGTRYPISLSTGSNSVRVNVTAEDGVTTKVYRATITRAELVVSE